MCKLFYKIDVRKYGSGNLGATNVARNLGTKPGLLVLFLDLIKAGLPAMIMYFIAAASITNNPDPLINSQSVYLSIVYCATGVFACLGHCNPIFAGFKGGKAVASIAGFVLFMNWRITLLAFFVFLLVALTTKIISLASMSAMTVGAICIFIPFFTESYLFTHGELNNQLSRFIYFFSIILLALLLIYRHYPNIQRLLKGEEKKFKIEKIFKNDKK